MSIRLRDLDLGILDGDLSILEGKEPRAKGGGTAPEWSAASQGLALDHQIGSRALVVLAGQTAVTGNIGYEIEPLH
jgi:hypothetical protein